MLLSQNDQVIANLRKELGANDAVVLKQRDWDRVTEFLQRSMSKKDYSTIVKMGIKMVPLKFEKTIS